MTLTHELNEALDTPTFYSDNFFPFRSEWRRHEFPFHRQKVHSYQLFYVYKKLMFFLQKHLSLQISISFYTRSYFKK